jgi:hypothetical protein
VLLEKYNENHPAVQSTRETINLPGLSCNTYSLLFGQGVNKSQTGCASHLPSVEEEWESYCHAANWPDICSMDLKKWWDVRKTTYDLTSWLIIIYFSTMMATIHTFFVGLSIISPHKPRRFLQSMFFLQVQRQTH